jgi:TPR repeat protein
MFCVLSRDKCGGVGLLVDKIGKRTTRRFRRAIASDGTLSAKDFAMVMVRDDLRQEAIELMFATAAAGNPTALANLSTLLRLHLQSGCSVERDLLFDTGMLFASRGDPEQAGRWWHLAADAGSRAAMINFSRVLAAEGQFDESDDWFRQAEDVSEAAGADLTDVLEPGARNGDVAAMFDLGRHMHRLDRREEAARWWRSAAEGGNVGAAERLGNLLIEDGDQSGGEHWLGLAADRMYALGNPGVTTAEGSVQDPVWLARAAALGHAPAMVTLAMVMHDRFRPAAAEDLLRRAAEAGAAVAMSLLAVVLESCARAVEAEHWYRQAAEAGEPRGIAAMAVMLADQERLQEAQHCLAQAADCDEPILACARAEVTREHGGATETGDAEAAHHFAGLMKRRRDCDRAEVWYRRAAAWGHPHTAHSLELLAVVRHRHSAKKGLFEQVRSGSHAKLEERRAIALQTAITEEMAYTAHRQAHDTALHRAGPGPSDERVEADRTMREHVEDLCRRVAQADTVTAGAILAGLRERQFPWDQAENWWRSAADTHDASAMNTLGLLYSQREEPGEAERWWRLAAEAGSPQAKASLGDLAQDQGRRLEAAQWYREAAEAGVEEAIDRLVILLVDLGRWDEADKWKSAGMGTTLSP